MPAPSLTFARALSDRPSPSLTFARLSIPQLLAEDSGLTTPSAQKLQSLFRKWMANEGRDIVSHTRRIEIVDADGKLARVYFQMPEFVETVWRSTVVEAAKRELLFKVCISRLPPVLPQPSFLSPQPLFFPHSPLSFPHSHPPPFHR